MRLTVGREALGEAVAFVARALPSRPVVPLLSGILMRADPGELTLSCFDYEVSARITVGADVRERGEALVPGRLLAEITRSLPASPVYVADEGDVVSLTCGRSEFGLVGLPAREYPALPRTPSALGEVDAPALASAVGQVVTSASRDDTLPMLTAICLDIDDAAMTLAATDRYRLAVREIPFRPTAPGLRAVALVPARVMAEMARALAADPVVTIAFQAGSGDSDPGAGQGAGRPGRDPRPADGLISFQSADRQLTARLITGEFIKYRTRFPVQFGSRAEFPAGPAIDAVRRAALVAERAGPVRLSFGPDQVVIEAHAEGRARAAETVPAVFSGDSPVISFNPHYLLEGLVAAAADAAAARSSAAEPPGGPESAPETVSPQGPEPTGESAPLEDGQQSAVPPRTEAPRDPAAPEPRDDAGSRSGPAPGRLRLEYNTPAKPALISWAGDEGEAPDPREPRAAGPGFRYLLVPLRMPSRA